MICPLELKRRYQEGRVIPFIGAGVSMSVKWTTSTGEERRGVSWSQLVEKAIELLGFQLPELLRVRGTDLQILEYFKLVNGGQTAKLTNWLSSVMDPQDDVLQVSPIHLELSRLDKCSVIYTTNYDDFIERSFQLSGRQCDAIAIESQNAGHRNQCEIIKFHGDFNHPDQIVLTESDYEKRLNLSTAMDLRLRADLLGRVILFIGYSFRDPNVSYLFRLFTEDFMNKIGSLPGYRAYIVVADPSDFELRLFKERKIEVIPASTFNISNDIQTLLSEMRS